jgi:hypothetical protein
VPQKGANTQWAASMHKTARWPAPAACNLGSRLFFTGVLGVHVGLGREHADLDRTGAISPFIWWRDEVYGAEEGISAVHRETVGVWIKPLASFGLALHRNTKPSLCEGQVACVYNPTNNRPWSRHTHQAASVGSRVHGRHSNCSSGRSTSLDLRDSPTISRDG